MADSTSTSVEVTLPETRSPSSIAACKVVKVATGASFVPATRIVKLCSAELSAPSLAL